MDFNFNFIFLFYLLLKLKSILSFDYDFNFTYSKVQELNNGNFIVLTEKGIYVFNSELNQIINEFIFEELKDELFMFTSLISIYPYEDTVFFFFIDENKFIIYENETFSNLYDINHEYYKLYIILIPFKKENDKHFLLGYINYNSNYTFFFDYFIFKNETLELKKTFNTQKVILHNNNIACDIFHTLYNNDNIICTNFEKNGNLSISIFNLENFSNNLTFTYFINNYSQFDIFYLIIEISKDNSKALICYYNRIDQCINCLIFNIFKNEVEQV